MSGRLTMLVAGVKTLRAGRQAGRVSGLLLAAFLLFGTPSAAQERAALSGIALDAYTNDPVARARVILPDLGLSAVTDATGQFFMVDLPLGAFEARFEADGYVTVVEEIELAAAEFLQVRLSPVAAVLDELLVLARRTPSASSASDPTQIRNAGESWRSVLNLLEDQVPGLVVRRQGALASGAAIYIRGFGTFQGSGTPDVYLDGVRIDAAASRNGVHALDMIPADVVSRIRVYKGAAGGAATRNPNGMIVIETHRGGSNQP